MNSERKSRHSRIKTGPLVALSILSVIARQDMPCEITSTHSHRKTHSLSIPRETIPFLNPSISLPITAPSKHLHQCRSKCWQQLRDKASPWFWKWMCAFWYITVTLDVMKKWPSHAYAPFLSKTCVNTKREIVPRQALREGGGRKTG